jgi:hypothetical protein
MITSMMFAHDLNTARIPGTLETHKLTLYVVITDTISQYLGLLVVCVALIWLCSTLKLIEID